MKTVIATIADDTWCYLRTESGKLCSNEHKVGEFAVSKRLHAYVSSASRDRCLYIFNARRSQYVHARFPGLLPPDVSEEIERVCPLLFLLR